MQKKMRRKVLAALLAVSMCVTCLPVGMGQVKAEDGTESAVTLTEQTDVAPEMVGDTTNGADESVTAEVPEETEEPGTDVAEESDVDTAEESDKDTTEEPDADTVDEPDKDTAEESEEMEDEEEIIHNYDASTKNVDTVEEDCEYTEYSYLPKEYTFTPKEDGIYYVSADLGKQDRGPWFYCRDNNGNVSEQWSEYHWGLDYTYNNGSGKMYWAKAFELKKDQTYTLSWGNIVVTEFTWKIYRMDPKTVELDKGSYTHTYGDHYYYTFVPATTGLYRAGVSDNAKGEFGILSFSDQYGSDIRYENDVMELKAGEPYRFAIYGGEPGDSVSFQIRKVEMVSGIKEDTLYEETEAAPKIYTFSPSVDGVYFVEAVLNNPYDKHTISLNMRSVGDETGVDSAGTTWLWSEGSQSHHMKSPRRLEAGKTYRLEWQKRGDLDVEWKIYRLERKEFTPGVEMTHQDGDHVYYTFTPEKDGAYSLRMDGYSFDTISLSGERGDRDAYAWSMNNLVKLTGGTPYEFVFYKRISSDSPESSVTWRMIKAEEVTAKENQDYTESNQSVALYTFVPNESGVYSVEVNSEKNSYASFNCYSIEDKKRIYPFYDPWSSKENKLIQLEKGKEYKLEWANIGDDGFTWKIFRMNHDTRQISLSEEYTHKYDSHAYYTFTPAKTGAYKLFIKDNPDYKAVMIEDIDGYASEKEISSRWTELTEGHTYKLYFTNMHSGDAASWALKMKEDVAVEVNKDYNETGEGLHRYLFTPAETGTYMAELKIIGSGWMNINHLKNKKTGAIIYPNTSSEYNPYRYYVNLESDTTYEICFFDSYGSSDNLSEIQCTWNIRKISNLPFELNRQYTHSTGDLICYDFTPQEDGLYQLAYDKKVVYEIYKNASDSEARYDVSCMLRDKNNGYDVYALKKDVAYRIVMRKPQDVENEIENCTMQMRMMSPSKIEKTDTIYKKAKNEPGYYKFTADKAGRYLVEGIVLSDTLEGFDSWLYGDKVQYLDVESESETESGTSLCLVSLEENETISIVVPGSIEEVCVRSAKRTSDGVEYVQLPDGTIAIIGYNGEKKEVVIPDQIDGINVASIETRAFYQSDVTSVKLPSTLKKIGSSAFWRSQLTEIVIPDSVTTVASGAFGYCSALKKAVLGTGINVIEYSLFTDCEALEEVVIPARANITEIEGGAFRGCTSLSNITFPDTIEKCGGNAFGYYDENYTAWYKNLPDGEVYIGKALYAYKGTVPEGTKVTVKPGTVSVTSNAYAGQTGVSEVILPYGLKYLGTGAFACGKNLKSIVIPASVTDIGEFAVGHEGVLSQYGYYYNYNKLDGFVIYGQKDSIAEKYAKAFGFEFIEKAMLIRGDVDLSGKVDISDLRMMLRYVCGKVELTEAQIQAGDIVGKTDAEASDGKVTIADLRKLLRFICGKVQTL